MIMEMEKTNSEDWQEISVVNKDTRQETTSGEKEISEQAREKINELEKENENLRASFDTYYIIIGKNYYEQTPGYQDAMDSAVGELEALEKQIDVNGKNILRLKGFRLCPNCEKIVDDNAVFCGECGTRMEPVPEPDEESLVCKLCGAKNPRGKKFCSICGQSLIEISCPECGTKLPADALFCGECGTQLK